MAATTPRPSLARARLELRDLLHKRGFWLDRVVEHAIVLWGARAAEVVRRDPFRLMTANVVSCGFKRCDRLYRDLKLPLSRTKRLMFAVWAALRDASGDTWHPWGVAVEAGLKERATAAQVEKAIRLGVRSGWLSEWSWRGSQRWIAVGRDAKAERELAERVQQLSRWMPPMKRAVVGADWKDLDTP